MNSQTLRSWLEYLTTINSDYANVEINEAALASHEQNVDVSSSLIAFPAGQVWNRTNCTTNWVNGKRSDGYTATAPGHPCTSQSRSCRFGCVYSWILPCIIPRCGFLGESAVQWPVTGTSSIDEFVIEGCICMAFPTLFPTDRTDYSGPAQPQKFTAVRYFQHLMSYTDDRFAKHPQFQYLALDSVRRWSVVNHGTVCIHKTALSRTERSWNSELCYKQTLRYPNK